MEPAPRASTWFSSVCHCCRCMRFPMLIWFIWRAFHWKRDDKDWLKGTAILAIAVVAPVLLWLSAWYAPVLLWLSALVCVD